MEVKDFYDLQHMPACYLIIAMIIACRLCSQEWDAVLVMRMDAFSSCSADVLDWLVITVMLMLHVDYEAGLAQRALPLNTLTRLPTNGLRVNLNFAVSINSFSMQSAGYIRFCSPLLLDWLKLRTLSCRHNHIAQQQISKLGSLVCRTPPRICGAVRGRVSRQRGSMSGFHTCLSADDLNRCCFILPSHLLLL